MSIAEGMFREHPDLDPDDPSTIEDFFRGLYFASDVDTSGVQASRASYDFETVGRKFRLIEDHFTRPVIIPWEEGAERLERLRRALKYAEAGRDLFRALQPYTVSVYEKPFRAALEALEEVHEELDLYALSSTHMRHYHEKYGLVIGDDIAVGDSEAMIL